MSAAPESEYKAADPAVRDLHESSAAGAPGSAYALAILTLVYTFNFLDRHILNIVAQPMKEELSLADWQVCLLSWATMATLDAAAFCPPYRCLGVCGQAAGSKWRNTCRVSPQVNYAFSRWGLRNPGAGTDTTKIKTTAVKKDGRYVVNGQKIWISRVQHSDLMILLARTTSLAGVKKFGRDVDLSGRSA